MEDDLIEDFENKKWYFQGFNATPAFLYGPARSMVHDMPEYLGFGYSTGTVIFFENDVCYYVYSWDDLYAVRDQILKKYEQDKTYIDFLLNENEKVCEKVAQGYAAVARESWEKLDLHMLYSLWRRVNRLYGYLLSISHIVEGFSLTTESEIRERVKKEFSDDFTQKLLLLTTPQWHSFLATEHYELVQIAEYIQSKNISHIDQTILEEHVDIKQKIQEHQKKYFWKVNSYTCAKSLTVEDFIKEINDLLTKKNDCKKVKEEYESLEARFVQKQKLVQSLKDKKLAELMAVSDVFFRIHDRRKEYMTQSITYLDGLLKEIAKRLFIPLNPLRYIRESELEQLPEIVPTLLERRKKSVYVVNTSAESQVFVGEQADRFFECAEKLFGLTDVKELKGDCASVGKVVGKVKVCRGEEEIKKVKHGDVLVACMTQPEFVPAMKIASAVVTDEGGLTCHAAIVSRELGIPCVIGTKVGTKVLKDGDMVEVDADNGVIKILS